jgi:hypothetical protein
MSVWKRFTRWLGFGYKPQTKIAARHDDEIVQRYIDTGLEFGDAVSMIYMGECIGFDKLLAKWEEAEQAYSDLGFRTLTLDAFVDSGGWGKELEGLSVARDEGEEPVFHAKYYREHYLGKNMIVGLDPVGDSGAVVGHYIRPSTEHLVKEK